MKHTVVGPSGLHWTVKRLVVPTVFLPLSRTELLDAATPRRTVVAGMDRQVPDAVGGVTGPIPLAFLFTILLLPLVPVAMLLRRLRILSWTIEARAYPWGRRYPPIVHTYAVRGAEESQRAIAELVAALQRGDGAPVLTGAEQLDAPRDAHGRPPVVGRSGPRQFDA